MKRQKTNDACDSYDGVWHRPRAITIAMALSLASGFALSLEPADESASSPSPSLSLSLSSSSSTPSPTSMPTPPVTLPTAILKSTTVNRPNSSAGGDRKAVGPHAATNASCRYFPDARPLGARLKKAPIAFIGTVKEIKPNSIVYVVEHPIAGGMSVGKHEIPYSGFVIKAGKTEKISKPMATAYLRSCANKVKVGDRWLYAGDQVNSPSMLLGRGGEINAESMGVLRRLDDSILKAPAKWQACKSDSECKVVPYGCSATSGEAKYAERLEYASIKLLGHPMMMNCMAAGGIAGLTLEKPLCVANRCGMWGVAEKRETKAQIKEDKQ